MAEEEARHEASEENELQRRLAEARRHFEAIFERTEMGAESDAEARRKYEAWLREIEEFQRGLAARGILEARAPAEVLGGSFTQTTEASIDLLANKITDQLKHQSRETLRWGIGIVVTLALAFGALVLNTVSAISKNRKAVAVNAKAIDANTAVLNDLKDTTKTLADSVNSLSTSVGALGGKVSAIQTSNAGLIQALQDISDLKARMRNVEKQ